jgi:RNA polymerase sigma factor (TIGR02999 family)
MGLVYTRLRALARRQMQAERAGHTLDPTALVHEAYLRLVDQRVGHWESQGHFFAVAAEAMRRILVDHARRRGRQRRGGGLKRVGLEQAEETPVGKGGVLDMLELDGAMNRLAGIDPTGARIVEMRYFAGMSVGLIAQTLGLGERTVRRHWVFAKAWLSRELWPEGGSGPGEATGEP